MRTLLVGLVLATAAFAGERLSRSFTFLYDASLALPPAGAKQARLWIPVPSDSTDQEITNIRVRLTAGETSTEHTLSALKDVKAVGSAPVRCTVAKVEGGWGRSLCVETPGAAVAVRLVFDVKRYESNGDKKATKEELAAALRADAMIPLGKKASRVAEKLPAASTPLETGRLLYEHTLERMRYDKPAGGDWGRGDAEWACDARHGNCTDFHSYFIALARTKQVPARFEMGFPVAGGNEKEKAVGGYHCWAHFWVEGHGWVPVDISEADKHPDKAEYFFGTLDPNRVTMTRGRDLLLTPRPARGALNFFVYPYAEVDGKEFKRVEKAFKRVSR